MEETVRSDTSTDGQETLAMGDASGGHLMGQGGHGLGQDSKKAKDKKGKSKTRETLSVDFDSILPHVGEMGIYQIGLFFLMCIPACLPAAFLAFNQVFLSASPDHWCKVTELNKYNLPLTQVKNLSIPYNYDKEEFDKCSQYDVNFTEIYEVNGQVWPQTADPRWNISSCKEGWEYDRSEYKDSLVTEVSRNFFICTIERFSSRGTQRFNLKIFCTKRHIGVSSPARKLGGLGGKGPRV